MRELGSFSVWDYTPRGGLNLDAASAIAHEYNAHIDPAIANVMPSIKALEDRKFGSEAECKEGCKKTASFVKDLFGATLKSTQDAESKKK